MAEMEEKLEYWLVNGQINLNTSGGTGGFDPAGNRTYTQCPAHEVLSVLKDQRETNEHIK